MIKLQTLLINLPIPKEVLEEIRHEHEERATEAARVHQLQEDRAKAEGHVTVDQIRNK